MDGTDALQGKATGAPLRALAILTIAWLLARIISWHAPEDFANIPSGQLAGKPVTGKYTQIGDARQRILPNNQLPLSLVAICCTNESQDITIPSDTRHRPMRTYPAKLQALPDRASISMMRPKIDAHALPIDSRRQLADSRSEVIEYHLPLSHNTSNERHREGFSGYFWAFARPAHQTKSAELNGGRAIISNGQYGGGQFGAILSYPISSQPNPELAVYGRFTAALAPLEQEEIAAGLRLHPFRDVPYTIHAEQRFDADSGGGRGTAIFAAGGTGPDPIVKKMELETYAQAGYVFGENETYFFDGAATLQRPVAEFGRKTVSVGAGIWAGGQRKIARLDAGPRADFRAPLGTTPLRISVDWRVRLAGSARPNSGLAITLSTGF